jgi:hypothetical protein
VTLTLQDLVDADPGAFSRSAQAWEAMAEGLDDATEDLIRGSRDLEHVWPDGPAAQAAAQKTHDTRNEASNAVLPCRRIARALREHADTIRSLQGHTTAIAAEARGKGYLVDLTAGTVAAGAALIQDSSAGQFLAQAITSYVAQLRDVLDQAFHCDQTTAGIIKANLPNTDTGFGSTAGFPISKAEVDAQHGRPPADVNAWWDGLTPEQQEQAIRDFPQLVGWLDGVPATDRDTANRLSLAQQRADLDAREADLFNRFADATPPQKAAMLDQLEDIRAQRGKLDEVDKALTKLGPRGFLLGLDTTGDGRGIVAVGNPDTAAHTGVWVPGLGTTLEGKGMSSGTVDNIDRMIALNNAAQNMSDTGAVSTVYWLGYDAPDLTDTSVAGEERSKAGAEPYVNFMQGMRATHEGDPGHLVAMGHSYGTTVLGEAALTGRLPVDDIITQGSPGMHTDHARNLHIDPTHVWAGSADNDPVSQTSNVTKWTPLAGTVVFGPVAGPVVGGLVGDAYEDGHNISPHTPDFGANSYRVDTSGHSAYWDEGSESLRNQARILVGDYQRTTLNHGQAPPEIP